MFPAQGTGSVCDKLVLFPSLECQASVASFDNISCVNYSAQEKLSARRKGGCKDDFKGIVQRKLTEVGNRLKQ
jgi:hypothetical protein